MYLFVVSFLTRSVLAFCLFLFLSLAMFVVFLRLFSLVSRLTCFQLSPCFFTRAEFHLRLVSLPFLRFSVHFSAFMSFLPSLSSYLSPSSYRVSGTSFDLLCRRYFSFLPLPFSSLSAFVFFEPLFRL